MSHVDAEVPSHYLSDHLDLLKTAPELTALDVACGRGRNSVYLAENGFTVTGLELNDAAIAAAWEAAGDLPITVDKYDLESPEATLPKASHGVVCVFYFLYRPLLPHIREAVKPGGFVVYETFLIDAHERFGSPGRAEFAFGHNELLETFAGFRIHHYEERVDEARKTALTKIIAQRPPGGLP